MRGVWREWGVWVGVPREQVNISMFSFTSYDSAEGRRSPTCTLRTALMLCVCVWVGKMWGV